MTGLVKRTPIQEVCETIASPEFGNKLAQALPQNVTLDRFTRVTLTAVQQNPEVITADRQSLYNSVIRCAQDGLLPDGREAALVVFNQKGEKKVQYMPMVGGLRKVSAKHGITLNAFVVYANDEFDYELGEAPHVHHKPPRLDQERGEPIGAYATATDRDGRLICPPEVMSRGEIEKVRNVSRAKDSQYGPWVNWWDQMARKTVARRLFKQLPLGDLDEQSAAVLDAADDEFEFETPRMSVEEANVSAAIGRGAVPTDGGPDDSLPEHVEGEVVEDGEQPAFEIPTTARQASTVAAEVKTTVRRSRA